MTHKLLTLTATLLLMISSPSYAETMELGPAIGTPIPHDLMVMDQNGNKRSFKDLTGEKGLVIAFFRSAKWCPFCQIQLIDLNMHVNKQAAAKGYNLVGISYDNTEVLAQFTKKWSIGYPLLADEGSKIIDAFGIRNDKDYKPGEMPWGVPYPMLVITDHEGVVKAKLSKEGYRNRPEPEVLLEALTALENN